MATVSGLTKERMLEIEAQCIVNGAVDLSGHLQLTKHDGTTVDAGSVKGPKGDVGPPGSVLGAWPVGAIFFAVVATNPALLLGGGTWERWGQGRMPISQLSSDANFDTAEETGGEKSHTLTEAELASHGHGVYDPGHSHYYGAAEPLQYLGNRYNTDSVAAGFSSVRGWTFPGRSTDGAGTGISVNAAGGNQPHNNMPPFIVCYIWKRTA